MTKTVTTVEKKGSSYVWVVKQATTNGWMLRDAAGTHHCGGQVVIYKTAQGHLPLCLDCQEVLA